MNNAATTRVGIGYFTDFAAWEVAAKKASCTFEKRTVNKQNHHQIKVAVATDGVVIGKFRLKKHDSNHLKGFLVSSSDAMRALHRYGTRELEYSKGPQPKLSFWRVPQWLRSFGRTLAARFVPEAC